MRNEKEKTKTALLSIGSSWLVFKGILISWVYEMISEYFTASIFQKGVVETLKDGVFFGTPYHPFSTPYQGRFRWV